DVICAVWLTISPRLGNSGLNVLSLLKHAGRDKKKVPMGFLYGDGDASAENLAKDWRNALIRDAKDTKDAKSLYLIRGIKDGGKLTGAALLDDKLDTENIIVKGLQLTQESRPLEDYEDHKMDRSTVWSFTAGRLIPAREPAE